MKHSSRGVGASNPFTIGRISPLSRFCSPCSTAAYRPISGKSEGEVMRCLQHASKALSATQGKEHWHVSFSRTRRAAELPCCWERLIPLSVSARPKRYAGAATRTNASDTHSLPVARSRRAVECLTKEVSHDRISKGLCSGSARNSPLSRRRNRPPSAVHRGSGEAERYPLPLAGACHDRSFRFRSSGNPSACV